MCTCSNVPILDGCVSLSSAATAYLQQGDIESVAAMQPRDVTTLFESISGSEALRKDYEAKQSEKTAAEERVSHITARKRQLGAEKRQVSA